LNIHPSAAQQIRLRQIRATRKEPIIGIVITIDVENLSEHDKKNIMNVKNKRTRTMLWNEFRIILNVKIRKNIQNEKNYIQKNSHRNCLQQARNVG